ncbi:hypothetical protein DSECCO2_591390 [anaerobic digester metagenome]
MKLIRMPPIHRETYEIFKKGVEKRNKGQIWGNLPEEIQKALIFYEKSGKDVHYVSFNEMNQYLEGVSWKVVVDVDGSEIHDLTDEFILAFGDVELIQKKAIIGFIEVWTGKNGNYTYRKYSKQFRDDGLIKFDNKIKVFRPTQHCKKEFIKLKESQKDLKFVKVQNALGGVDTK